MNDTTEKNEIILYGGELDGLSLNVSDRTVDWPFAITFEMFGHEGQKAKSIRYEVINCGELPNDGDSFAQYMHISTTEIDEQGGES